MTEPVDSKDTSAASDGSVVLGECRYCGGELKRGESHECDASEQEYVRQPFSAVPTGNGAAIRDAKGRCFASVNLQKWMTDRAKRDAHERLVTLLDRVCELTK